MPEELNPTDPAPQKVYLIVPGDPDFDELADKLLAALFGAPETPA